MSSSAGNSKIQQETMPKKPPTQKLPPVSPVPPDATPEQLHQAITERDRLITVLLPLAGISNTESANLSEILTACLNLPLSQLPESVFKPQIVGTDVYQGETIMGKPYGTGEMKGSGGCYIGEWINGKKNGQGEYVWNTGAVYTGAWVDSKRCGFGIYKGSNSVEYKGMYKDDKKEGWGVLKWPNGTTMYAEYMNNLLNGVCIEICSDGKTLWIKNYRKDKLHGAWKRFDLIETANYSDGVLVQ